MDCFGDIHADFPEDSDIDLKEVSVSFISCVNIKESLLQDHFKLYY